MSEVLRLGLLGRDIAHSLSPRLHRAAGEATGLVVRYDLFDVPLDALDGTLEALRTAGVRGFNVTRPYKEALLTRVERLTPEAAAIGAVNTVTVTADGLEGHDTDAEGFAAALGVAPGPAAVVVGAGGAARAVVVALVRAGVERVVVANRDPARAAALVEALAPARGLALPLGALERELGEADLLVHCTPTDAVAAALPVDRLPPGARVIDLRYGAAADRLRRRATARGLRFADGLEMLAEQGRAAFARWTGRLPPRDPLLGALTAVD